MKLKRCDYCNKDIEENMTIINRSGSKEGYHYSDKHVLELNVREFEYSYGNNTCRNNDICSTCVLKYIKKILEDNIDDEEVVI